MGGLGSGRRRERPVVEEGLALDLNRLLRAGRLVPGRRTAGTLRWTLAATGEEVGSAGFEACLRDPDGAWLRLRYRRGPGGAAQDRRVRLVATRPNYGGLRWWFLCPASGRRWARLHLPPGGDLFASRQAWRLGYASQRAGPPDRLGARVVRLKRRLGAPGLSVHEAVPPRPRGMWRRTYGRRLGEILEAERRFDAWLDAAMEARLAAADRPLGHKQRRR